MPNPCQSINDEIDQINANVEDLQEELKTLAGTRKQAVARQIAKLNRDLQKKLDDLDNCLQAGQPGYLAKVVFFDACATTTVPANPVARMYKMHGNASAWIVESHTCQGGQAQFRLPATLARSSVGLSIVENANNNFDGALFRSGSLQSLPGGAAGEVNILVPCPGDLTQDELIASLPPTPYAVDQKTSIDSFQPTLDTSGMTLVLRISRRIVGPVRGSITYTVNLQIRPSFDMLDLSRICEVAAPVPGTISGMFGPPEAELRQRVVDAVTTIVNKGLQDKINSFYPSGHVPNGATISMRRVYHGNAGLRVWLAIGAFGFLPTP